MDRRVMPYRLLAALLALLLSASTALSADRILGAGRIDSLQRVLLPGGPTLGTWIDGKYTSKPDVLNILGLGSTGDVSSMSVSGVLLNKALGFSGITRSDIPSSFVSALQNTIVTSGYYTVGDRGSGCVYVRGTSSGPAAVRDALGAWWQLPLGKALDVTCFGARMDGTTDDTPAVQSALNVAYLSQASSTVLIPGGVTRLCQVLVPGGVRLSGAGPGATGVFAVNSTCDVFRVANETIIRDVVIENLAIYAANGVQQTVGYFVYFKNCWDCRLSNFRFGGPAIGVQVDGSNTVGVTLDHGRSQDAKLYHIVVSGGADTHIENVIVPVSSLESIAGILISHTGGTWITDVEMAHAGHGLMVEPQNNQRVFGLFVQNSALGDLGSGHGMYMHPAGTGFINQVKVANSWTASNNGSGVHALCEQSNGVTGKINDVQFTSHTSSVNGGNGFYFGCGTGIRLIAPSAQSNSNPNHGATAGQWNGIQIAQGVSDFVIRDGFFQPSPGQAPNQKNSILVENGASNYYVISGNNGVGGTTTGVTVQDNGTGTSKLVQGNW